MKTLGILMLSLAPLLGAGCGVVEKIVDGVEFCVIHPKYGKVCVGIGDKLYVRADLELSPEERETLEKYVQDELAKRRSN